MFENGRIVEVYEDPLTMNHKEGNAKIIEHVVELEPGVDQYKVNFVGDDPSLVVVRTIVEEPCACAEFIPDSPLCKRHGRLYASYVSKSQQGRTA